MNQPYWRGVLAGIIVGAGAALLLAPKRGEELRDELLESADDWKDKAAKSAHDVTETVKKNLGEVSTAIADSAQEPLADAREIVAQKRDEVAQKADEIKQKADDVTNESDASESDLSETGDHHEVEVGAALAQALGDDEMLAQSADAGEVTEVQNLASDDIAPTPGVRAASEKTLDEIQTQTPESNTEPAAARAAQAQPLEDKIAAAVEVAREDAANEANDETSNDETPNDETPNDETPNDDSPLEVAMETVTDKVEDVTEAVADKASEDADAAAEEANDGAEKVPDAVIDAPADAASEDQPAKSSSSKRRGKNRRKRATNS